MLHFARQGKVFGFEHSRPRADLALMQRRKKEIIAEFADYRTAQLKDGRFSLYRSKAKFVDQSSIKFTDGKTIKGDRFVLATGSQIAMPPVPGLDQVSFKTSDEVLELTEVPNEVVVLGGGIVACELAQFLQRVIFNKTPWAHLDIAGMAVSKYGGALNSGGATGFGVRLLNQLVEENYE